MSRRATVLRRGQVRTVLNLVAERELAYRQAVLDHERGSKLIEDYEALVRVAVTRQRQRALRLAEAYIALLEARNLL